jgi:membrane-associated phospholipid phosphatase
VATVAGGLVVTGLAAWAAGDPTTPWTGDLGACAPSSADAPLDRAALELSRATAPLGNALAVIAALALLSARARWRDLALVATAVSGAGIGVLLLHETIDVERPLADPLGPHAGSAFPSAHAASWAALASALALVTPRRRRAPVAAAGGLLVLAIGASRVHLGAHDPRDVVAGLALGVTCATGAAWALDRVCPRARGGRF